ncbi:MULTISPECIES: SHOCT domain-containing protein [unclassified Neisseria]|uniref:SHOCT domain-containing protein n=1 Tax=unclassified Neisseria TaxID=2623750 RepID=UPI002665FFF6|nr:MULTISPECIES: SHOCT domain-containing protein [unclassified Neisseria]MDO1509337.1 SHOCT domain-containing protein [Neisseria sp. MVDL19-042950]MDO1515384.1 SHOCT domain-containing protein [Neisseria sp. MVDL18-041461]MDO1562744.1 SHOCT domain-containing protein [Neisseria sp. MVDL20-010259]
MSKLNILLAFILTGCTTTSGIQPIEKSISKFDTAMIYKGKETILNVNENKDQEYRIFHQGASGFTPPTAIRNSAEKRAKAFCSQQNKEMKAIKERTSVPPHVLGNWPRIEIIFICVESNHANVDSYSDDKKYDQLVKLKKLLDQGVLSEQEFNKEKAKILGH